MANSRADNTAWPKLPALEAWQNTFETLHMWTQIVGKIRLALADPADWDRPGLEREMRGRVWISVK